MLILIIYSLEIIYENVDDLFHHILNAKWAKSCPGNKRATTQGADAISVDAKRKLDD